MPFNAQALVDRTIREMISSSQRSFTNRDVRELVKLQKDSEEQTPSDSVVNRAMALLRKDHRLRVERVTRQKSYFRLRGMAG